MPRSNRSYVYVEQGKGWRSRLAKTAVDIEHVQGLSEEDRNSDAIFSKLEDLVYGMALDGCSSYIIADYLGVRRLEFQRLFSEVYKAGAAELKATIRKDTVDYGLKSQQPVAKIWLGKAIGGLSDGSGVEVDVQSDSGEVKVNIRDSRDRLDDAEAV